MSLQTWNQLHKDRSMAKSKTVKIMLNIGTDDVNQHALERPFQRDEVVALDDRQAGIIISRGWGKEYTDTVQAEDEAQREQERQRALRAAMPEALKKAAVKEAEAEAENIIHATPAKTAKNVKDADESEPAVSVVADMSVDQAINSIRHRTNKEELQAIADADKRTTVQQAARERLAAL
jgi:hypothetical protein